MKVIKWDDRISCFQNAISSFHSQANDSLIIVAHIPITFIMKYRPILKQTPTRINTPAAPVSTVIPTQPMEVLVVSSVSTTTYQWCYSNHNGSLTCTAKVSINYYRSIKTFPMKTLIPKPNSQFSNSKDAVIKNPYHC
ncbi:hypothetical protein ACTA71_010074 [Dictyostelium dimigraforme]